MVNYRNLNVLGNQRSKSGKVCPNNLYLSQNLQDLRIDRLEFICLNQDLQLMASGLNQNIIYRTMCYHGSKLILKL